jgi:NAD(P)-dependent dehydrogenase (short-subunit alcohol dehydrogenase family)
MVEAGRGTVLLTGATAALRGSARFSALAVGKFGLHALAQSMAREFGPQGVYVVHMIVDGQIHTPGSARCPPSARRTRCSPPTPSPKLSGYSIRKTPRPRPWSWTCGPRPAVESF